MSRPLHVLLLVDSLESHAGTENQMMEIVRRIDQVRFKVWVGCLEDGPRLQSLAPFATPLVLPVAGSVFSLTGARQIRSLRRTIQANKIDVIQTYMFRSSILGVMASQGGGRVVVTTRRNLGYWLTPAYITITRILNALSTRVLANCEGAKAVAGKVERLPLEGIDVLYNGVDMSRFARPQDPGLRHALGIPEHHPVVGIVANYRQPKNLPMFLRGAQIIARQHPEAYFLLVGRGPLQSELERLAVELGIADRVVMTDDRGDVASMIALMDIACLTSDSEAFSNSVLEYMASSRPVVATSVGGVPEAIKHDRTGFLVPPGDASAFALAVCELLANPDKRIRMGMEGHRRCAELFELDASVRRQEQYWEMLAKRRQH